MGGSLTGRRAVREGAGPDSWRLWVEEVPVAAERVMGGRERSVVVVVGVGGVVVVEVWDGGRRVVVLLRAVTEDLVRVCEMVDAGGCRVVVGRPEEVVGRAVGVEEV